MQAASEKTHPIGMPPLQKLEPKEAKLNAAMIAETTIIFKVLNIINPPILS